MLTGRIRSIDAAVLDRLHAFRKERGKRFPGVLLFFAACPDAAALRRDVEAIPAAVRQLLGGAFVYFTPTQATRLDDPPDWPELTVLRHVRETDYADNVKIGLQYALERQADYVLIAGRGDAFAPEAIPPLLEAALLQGGEVVVGVTEAAAPPDGRARRVNAALSFLLRTGLSDWEAGMRLFAAPVLRAAPFALNTRRAHFDTQLMIQAKILGRLPVEVKIPAPRGSRKKLSLAAALRTVGTALHYRLHQLHLMRHGRWLVDFGERYTFKHSPYGSHRRILDAVDAGRRVLDLGCSQGLLAAELAKKGCLAVGVDRLPPDKVKLPYDRYLQADLDDPALRLPFGREFEVVIVADVIEHLVRRESVLALVRRHLTEDGRLIISTGNIAVWFYRISLLLGRFEYGPRGILDETHVRLYTRATFKRLIRQAGFEILRIQTTPLPFEIVFQTHADNPLVRALDRVYHALTRWWPTLFAYQFIIEARIARLESAEAPLWPERQLETKVKH